MKIYLIFQGYKYTGRLCTRGKWSFSIILVFESDFRFMMMLVLFYKPKTLFQFCSYRFSDVLLFTFNYYRIYFSFFHMNIFFIYSKCKL